MSYLRYLYLLVYNDVQWLLCCVLFLTSSVASFYGLSIFDCYPFGVL